MVENGSADGGLCVPASNDRPSMAMPSGYTNHYGRDGSSADPQSLPGTSQRHREKLYQIPTEKFPRSVINHCVPERGFTRVRVRVWRIARCGNFPTEKFPRPVINHIKPEMRRVERTSRTRTQVRKMVYPRVEMGVSIRAAGFLLFLTRLKGWPDPSSGFVGAARAFNFNPEGGGP